MTSLILLFSVAFTTKASSETVDDIVGVVFTAHLLPKTARATVA